MIPLIKVDATKPVILAGGGIKNNGEEATKHLLALAEIVNAPCATSPGHGDLIPFNHPLNAGSAGPRGSGIGTQLLKEADVILVLGSRLGFNTTFYSYKFWLTNLNISSTPEIAFELISYAL